MQINNILDFDDEASAKAYNFTITAIKEFYDTIESDQLKHQEQGNPILKWITVPSCWQPSRKMTVWQVSQSRN